MIKNMNREWALGPANAEGHRGLTRQIALGSLFWFVFLLVLVPGNAVRAAATGIPLVWHEEVVRILAASLLGGLTAPAHFVLLKRFPLAAVRAAPNTIIHLLASATLAACLIGTASLLAPVVLAADNPRLARSLNDDLTSNLPLMTLAMFAMTALIQLSKFLPTVDTRAEPANHLMTIAVEGRDGTTLVDCAHIDWMQSHGNYVALHVGPKVHMARRTLTSLADRLDPTMFVRIHRRIVVNVTKVRSMKPLTNGDAVVYLLDATELRASRNFGKKLKDEFRSCKQRNAQ